MPLILPNHERKKRLTDIQKWLSEYKEDGGMQPIAKAVQLMLQESAFLNHVRANPELNKGAKSEAELMRFAWAYVLNLLYARDLVAASMVLWDSENFCVEPHCVQMIWRALQEKRMIIIIGGGGLGKTYSPSAYFLLEYILDPMWTKIQLASASQEHLLGNLFADIGRLHSGASLQLPGRQDATSIALDKKRAQGIFTLTLPGGTTGKSKIKGAHTKPRPPHPLFGRRSRVFCLIDECQEAPQNIFEEVANRFSTVNGDDVDHLKFVLCANARDIFSRFAKNAEPIGGWESITRASEEWQSRRGWTVLSLDQTKTENFKERRQVFPGFATYQGYLNLLNDCDGDIEHPRMYTLCYGKFPPQGTAFSVIKQRHLLASEGEWDFEGQTIALAGCDPAYSGDRPTFVTGRAGKAVGWRDSDGVEHKLEKPRTCIQIDAVTVLPHGDSQELADECMTRLKDLGVHPTGFGIDQTGRGLGTADITRHQWTQKIGPLADGSVLAPICGIEYAKSPTDSKIAEEDTRLCSEQFDRIATELWYAAAKLFEFDTIRIGKSVDVAVYSELASRRGEMQPGLGKKLTIETKDAYKKRTGGKSPDLADGTLVMIHAARLCVPGLTPKAKDTKDAKPAERAPTPWQGFNQTFGAADLQGMPGGATADMITD